MMKKYFCFLLLIIVIGCKDEKLFNHPIIDFSQTPNYVLENESNELIEDDNSQYPPGSVGELYGMREMNFKGKTSKKQEYTINYNFMRNKIFTVNVILPKTTSEEVKELLSVDFHPGSHGEFYDTEKKIGIIIIEDKTNNEVVVSYCKNDEAFQYTLNNLKIF
jgi:hypothetical protein